MTSPTNISVARFFRNSVWGKEGPYPCYVMFNFGLFKIIRYQTVWDGGAFTTWRTTVKFFWNVVEDEARELFLEVLGDGAPYPIFVVDKPPQYNVVESGDWVEHKANEATEKINELPKPRKTRPIR